MTVAACAELVRRGDPDRFLAVMAAPQTARATLFILYAFNLEIARAAWVTQEPLIAEMRLQWWRDAVASAASGAARAHEVAQPLHALILEAGLPIDVLDALIAARRWDIHLSPHDGFSGLDVYLEQTGAGLFWLAARALGAKDEAEPAVRAYGWAASAAAYLRAVPDLKARGRNPLPDEVLAIHLAGLGLEKLAQARKGRTVISRDVAPALLAGWQAESLLRQAVSGQSRLGLSEFGKRRRLVWQTLSRRW